MGVIAKHIELKPDSIRPPSSYLGADTSRYTLLDGDCDTPMEQVWAISTQEYFKQAIQNVDASLHFRMLISL